MKEKVKVVLVDDHVLLRNGLANMITSLGYEVMYECKNGRELLERIKKDNQPDIVLMDINMPEMDGYEATLWLNRSFPLVNVLALSMYDNENAIIRMIKNGAKGYIIKDSSPKELQTAIEAILVHGFYYSDKVTGRIINKIQKENQDKSDVHRLNEKEIEFLKLACTEFTYKEIAQRMNNSPRTIDGYRDQLFEKLNVKSRIGLVIYAIKNGIIQVN